MASVSLLKHFGELSDPRIERTKKYPLEEILLLIISAGISGCIGWKAIKDFGDSKIDWLKKYYSFDNGIPADDTIARIVRRLCPKTFKKCFFSWVKKISKKTNGDIIAIDGKTVRGSHDNNRAKEPIHIVSAWSNANKLILGQEKTSAKSNEITAIPNLLDMLDLKGCIVTIDAMGCQKTIAEKICKRGADYILSLKGNQGHLSEDTKIFFTDAYNSNFEHVEHDYAKDVDYGHGRLEIRECWTIRPKQYAKCFRNLSQWKNLETLAMVKSTREINGIKSEETRMYISSCSCDAQHLNNAIRCHWGVESMHWTLDVTFREDESRVRKGDGPENLSLLRAIALSTMKKYTSVKDSINSKIRKAALSDAFREDVLLNVMNISVN